MPILPPQDGTTAYHKRRSVFPCLQESPEAQSFATTRMQVGIPKIKGISSKHAIDAAKFNQIDIEAIYGDRPRCFLTGLWQFCDLHHIMGRGYKYGFNKRIDERAMFSSVFNCGLLNRDIHNGPYRDAPEMRNLLLRIARKNIMDAVIAGRYVLNENDEAFLAFLGESTGLKLV